MSELLPGTYTIVSKSTGQSIGRRAAEDKSFNPKAVVNHDQGVDPEKWVLKMAPGRGLFHLLIRGSPTADIDKKIYAILGEGESPVSWSLNRRPEQGANIFTIEKAMEGGWVLPSEDAGTQIAFRHLIIGTSDPPHFPDNQLWVITPALE